MLNTAQLISKVYAVSYGQTYTINTEIFFFLSFLFFSFLSLGHIESYLFMRFIRCLFLHSLHVCVAKKFPAL